VAAYSTAEPAAVLLRETVSEDCS